jgi:hypothetical protein
MVDETNKKPLTMEKLGELLTKIDKIAATVLPALHSNLQKLVQES